MIAFSISLVALKLWWTGNEFTMKLDENDYPCTHPAREFGKRPDFRLRSFVHEDPRSDRTFSRLLNSEGIVEFTLSHPRRESERSDDSKNSRAYFGWIFSLVVGAFAQIRHLQSSLAWDAIDFGLNVSVFGCQPITIQWNDDWMQRGLTLKNEIPLCLPQYEVTTTANVDELLSSIVRDISNACGIYLTVRCQVPASAIQASPTGR
jgi:hypothetical protein